MRKNRSSGTATEKSQSPPPLAVKSRDILAHPLLHIAIIALIALAAYANTFQVPFVFDDNSSIADNKVIRDLGAFLSGAGYAYNPRRFVGYLSFALNYKMGGLDPDGYHAVNLAVHIVSAWLVYFLAKLTLHTPFNRGQVPGAPECLRGPRASTASRPLSLIANHALVPLLAALLFVAHPVQTQSVTYVVQRLASLATMFYLLSLVLYIRARLGQEEDGTLFAPGALVQYSLCLIAALAAMRTKEIAATLPVVILLYELYFFGGRARKRLVVLIPILLTILIVPVGMLHVGKPLGEILSDVSEMARETRVISRGDYLLTQFSVVATYLRLLFFPVNQNLDYDYPLYHSFFTPRVFLSFLLLLFLFALAVYLYLRSRKSFNPASRLISFGILWFFITLSVESSFIPISDLIFEHRLYLPSVGAFIALAAVAAVACRKSPRTVLSVVALLVVVLAAASWQRNLVWASHLSLWGDTVGKSPDKSRANDSYAKALSDSGRIEEALGYVRHAVTLDARNGYAQYNAGSILDKLDRIDEAVTWYRSAIRLEPGLKEAYNNLAVDYLLRGEVEEAIAVYRTVLKSHPDFPEAHNNLGTILKERNRIDEAIDHYKAALSVKPDYAKALNNLGIAHMEQGEVDLAIKELQAAVGLKPDDRDFRLNLDRAVGIKESAK